MTAKEHILNLPNKVNSDAITGLSTLFHFDIEGSQGGQYTVKIADGKCETLQGFEGEPKCVVKAKDSTLADIMNGKTSPITAFFMGKVKVSNQAELLKYSKIFGFS